MAANVDPRKLVERQVRRVRRRLLIRQFVETIFLFAAGGLLLCALWYIIRPFVLGYSPEWMRFGVPGGVLGVSAVAALIWAYLRRPELMVASLALDKEFALKERVTTLTMLPPEYLTTAAGQALLEDVHDKVSNLDLRGRFPMQMRASSGLMPIVAGIFALAASFFNPSFGGANNRPNRPENSAEAKQIEQQLEALRKVVKKDHEDDLPRSAEMEELEKEWEKLVQKPLDSSNKEQVRERTTELAKLEDKIQKRIDDLKDRNADLKKHLDMLQLDKLGKKLEDGPAKDLEDALAKGKFNKAREVLEKLQKDLENNKLSKEDQQKLAEQVKELESKLKRLMDQKDRKEQLEKDFQDGKISKEELQREMNDLKKQAQEFQELGEFTDMLGQCKECLRAGKNLKAGERIKGMLEKLKSMELSDEETQRLLSDRSILREAIEGMCENCDGECELNGMRRGKRPGGIRPIGDEPDSKNIDAREKGEADPGGQQFITGFSRGGTFKKIPSTEVGGAFRRAVQEAPEAIERQHIPTEAEAQVRGYFQKLGRQ